MHIRAARKREFRRWKNRRRDFQKLRNHQINTGNITDTRVTVTTQLPIGDITSVIAGTNLTGGGNSGAVTVSIDTSTTLTQPDYVQTGVGSVGSLPDKIILLMMGAI
jgi:hypothetical protein